MAELSPAAEAVFDALNMSELNGPQQYMALAHAVAALRAAADQGEILFDGYDATIQAITIENLLAIAKELEAQQSDQLLCLSSLLSTSAATLARSAISAGSTRKRATLQLCPGKILRVNAVTGGVAV